MTLALDLLNKWRDDAGDDPDALVEILVHVRDLRADLATFAADVEHDLIPLAEQKRWVVPGIGEVAVRKATKRNEWDNSGLTARLVALALDERVLDMTTGEYESPWEAVARVLSECARPSWRVTPLRARGITVDEFCTERDGGYSIELPPRGA